MPFKKGHKKIAGKKPGTPNKRTAESVERVEFVLSLLEETLEEDIAKLPPRERTAMWKDLQEYVRPKLARVDNRVTGEVNVTFEETKTYEKPQN